MHCLAAGGTSSAFGSISPTLTFFPFQVGEWRRGFVGLTCLAGVGGLLFVIPVLGDLLVIVLLSKFLAVVQACGGLDFLAPIVLAR